MTNSDGIQLCVCVCEMITIENKVMGLKVVGSRNLGSIGEGKGRQK